MYLNLVLISIESQTYETNYVSNIIFILYPLNKLLPIDPLIPITLLMRHIALQLYQLMRICAYVNINQSNARRGEAFQAELCLFPQLAAANNVTRLQNRGPAFDSCEISAAALMTFHFWSDARVSVWLVSKHCCRCLFVCIAPASEPFPCWSAGCWPSPPPRCSFAARGGGCLIVCACMRHNNK